MTNPEYPPNTEPDRLRQAFIDTARKLYGNDELEFDDDAEVSTGDDPGAWVQCWRWITNDELTSSTCVSSPLPPPLR